MERKRDAETTSETRMLIYYANQLYMTKHKEKLENEEMFKVGYGKLYGQKEDWEHFRSINRIGSQLFVLLTF